GPPRAARRTRRARRAARGSARFASPAGSASPTRRRRRPTTGVRRPSCRPPRLRERAHDQTLAEHAEHLVHGGALPDVEERRVQQLEEEPLAPFPGLLLRLARPRRAQVADDP